MDVNISHSSQVRGERESVYILPRVNHPFPNSPSLPALPTNLYSSSSSSSSSWGVVVISGHRSQTVVLRRQKTAEWQFVSLPAGREGEVGRGEEGGGQQSPSHKHWEQPSRWNCFHYLSSSLFIQTTHQLWISKNNKIKKMLKKMSAQQQAAFSDWLQTKGVGR